VNGGLSAAVSVLPPASSGPCARQVDRQDRSPWQTRVDDFKAAHCPNTNHSWKRREVFRYRQRAGNLEILLRPTGG
jgi:hypothetical protein